MYLPKVAEIKVSYQPNKADKPVIATSLNAYHFFKGFYMGETICMQEQFSVMYLNRANKVLGVYVISKGGITGTVVDIRLTLAVALKTLATSILLCHNHPSGNLKPSQADKDLSMRIKEAAALMDIKVMDHIILTQDSYFSFADEGLL
ncbi:MAG TPA: JAB domain-containing protein [Parafilimonas sp.]|nr:JAB domain-containing protein [Parafilimonas sp.]